MPQRILLYTGHSRWLPQSTAFVQQFDLRILVHNNESNFHDKYGLFDQVIALSRNRYGETVNRLTLPVMEMYALGFGLITTYIRYGLIQKDAYLYCGHTDTNYELSQFELLLTNNPRYAAFVWERDLSPETFHSDAFLLNMAAISVRNLYRCALAGSDVLNAEHDITVKMKSLGECFVISRRGNWVNNWEGYTHLHTA